MDALAQLNSALIDRYEIEREIGAGGMATVYLARDLRHDRSVALKLLNPELGAVLGGERFLSEIKVTANLQHPNLLPLFDSGQVDGLLFYVMPFVSGETLRRRLDREKQLPVDEAVRIAVAVANALDYAHGHGVIHRDLKPENILLQHGQPIVADFGIALAVSNAGGSRVTQTGLSLGTPQYMSPEQATGDRLIDGRTDIYSLAAVTYEMLTGEPPHAGATAQAIIAKLMTEEVRPLTVLRHSVPSYVDAAIRRALEKLPADRFATAGQFAEALVTPRVMLPDFGAAPSAPGAATPAPSPAWTRVGRRAIPWTLAALGLTFGAWMIIGRPVADPPLPVHFTLAVPASMMLDPARFDVAVSPDGSHIVFIAGAAPQTQIWVRSLADENPRPLAGTEGARFLFLSPGGDWIGFGTFGSRLYRVAITGGPVLPVTTLGGFATWGSKNVIVFDRSYAKGSLFAIGATGGVARQITTLDSAHGEIAQRQPSFLPDGNAFLFVSYRGPSGAEERLAVGTLDGRVTPLDLHGTNPMFMAPNWLLFARGDGVIEAASFDPKRRRVTGPPTMVLDGVTTQADGRGAVMGVSSNGNILAYSHGSQLLRLALLSSNAEPQLLPGEPGHFRHPRVSPDGSRVAMDVAASDGSPDIWIYDLKSSALTRLTVDGRSMDPVWSPDGKRIAFTRQDSTSFYHVYSVASDGSEPPHLFVGGPGNQFAGTWTPDGKAFIIDEILDGPAMHVAAVTENGSRHILAGSPRASQRLAAISPDGQWLAYTSNETGRVEVYVHPMSGVGKWQVSLEGGVQPVWARDGKTLFYRDGRHIVAAAVTGRPTFSISARRNFADDHFAMENTINYAAMPDGTHLVVLMPVTDGARIRVVVNWVEELKRKLAEKN